MEIGRCGVEGLTIAIHIQWAFRLFFEVGKWRHLFILKNNKYLTEVKSSLKTFFFEMQSLLKVRTLFGKRI